MMVFSVASPLIRSAHTTATIFAVLGSAMSAPALSMALRTLTTASNLFSRISSVASIVANPESTRLGVDMICQWVVPVSSLAVSAAFAIAEFEPIPRSAVPVVVAAAAAA